MSHSGPLETPDPHTLTSVGSDPADDGLVIVFTASAAGALTEVVVGTPTPAVAATAAAPVIAEAGRRIIEAVRGRRADKVSQLLIAADILDPGLDILDERRPDYDQRLELLGRVIESAARSTLQEKVRALGRVLSDGLRADGNTHEALILAAALNVIEAPHALLLQYMDENPEPPPEWVRPGIDRSNGWEAGMLARSLPQTSDVLDGLLAVLAGQGLIKDLGGVPYPGGAGPAVWAISSLGRRCIYLLDDEA